MAPRAPWPAITYIPCFSNKRAVGRILKIGPEDPRALGMAFFNQTVKSGLLPKHFADVVKVTRPVDFKIWRSSR